MTVIVLYLLRQDGEEYLQYVNSSLFSQTYILQRHLRNAHPGEVEEGQKDGMDDDMQDLVGHHMDDSDRVSGSFCGGKTP
jgi:hypothetical protein